MIVSEKSIFVIYEYIIILNKCLNLLTSLMHGDPCVDVYEQRFVLKTKHISQPPAILRKFFFEKFMQSHHYNFNKNGCIMVKKKLKFYQIDRNFIEIDRNEI